MTTKDFTANVISATKVVPDGNFKDSKASGIWDINEALDLIKGGNWPNAANINPSAFVDALFQCHLYTGVDDIDQTITNGIDLSGSGGLVWIKNRDQNDDHALYDTERGIYKYLESNQNGAEVSNTTHLKAFNSNGFTIGVNLQINTNTEKYVSWTFRKQPKFFDVVTYTGTQDGDKTISHSLNTTVGMAIVKRYDANGHEWYVYHRSTGTNKYLYLNLTNAEASGSIVTATSNTTITLSQSNGFNSSGASYLVYLFAHNNDDGGFGEPGDQDIIKCGSYTGNGNATGPVIDLGFEPQWVMIKRANGGTGGWFIFDAMRGIVTGGNDNTLQAEANSAEGTGDNRILLTATGFQIETTSSFFNNSGDTYIYMAIRRGGMQTPTAASDVFAIDTGTGDHNASFPIDFTLTRRRVDGASNYVMTRLLGDSYLRTNATDAEGSFNFDNLFDDMTGVDFTGGSGWYETSDTIGWMWKRARGYFDVVAYTGTGSATTVAHNLGVEPEIVIVKQRSSGNEFFWYVKSLGNTKKLELPGTAAAADAAVGGNQLWNSTTPTSSVFSVSDNARVNDSGETYVAYLFATVANVSKVGSFTQSGATNVACGFTGDTPALIIFKRTDASGNWYLFDSARGIVAGNDKSLYLNTTDAEITNADIVDPYSGGFATTSSLTNGDYIFYAIASIA